MEEQQIYSRLTDLMRDLFDEPALVATPDLTAEQVKEWDSVNHVALIVVVEQSFGIKFKTAELEKMRNVAQMVEHIQKKLQ